MSKALAPGWYVAGGAAIWAASLAAATPPLQRMFTPKSDTQQRIETGIIYVSAAGMATGIGLAIYGIYKLLTKG